MTDSGTPSPAAVALLEAIAARVEAAGRIEPPGGEAVLRSIVEATVTLFDAEAASIALHDAGSDRLVFRVAAGEQGQGVVGLAISTHEGVAGYVFSTGQPLAIADVAADPRFGTKVAERTGYMPRSLLAVPLLDDETTLGVLEILDRRGASGFDLRAVELAGVFARQATVAIRATQLERDTASILREALSAATAAGAIGGTTEVDPEAIDQLVSAAAARLEVDGAGTWTLADRIARARAAEPESTGLLVELLDVLVRRSERRRLSGTIGRGGPGRPAARAGDDPER